MQGKKGEVLTNDLGNWLSKKLHKNKSSSKGGKKNSKYKKFFSRI